MKRKRRCSESRCRPVQRRDYMWRGRKHGERTGVKHLPVCEAAASVSVMQQRLEDLIPGRLQSHLSLNTVFSPCKPELERNDRLATSGSARIARKSDNERCRR
ncbi:uncharacterized protein LOC135114927 isoform X4 [Scylla paramamosain]|uniref:uncharacterized protein LOC135114927 isoform X4 n=1 Tax=Scylla paramamosain TaxID=85552 RepID=UPI003083DDD0